MTLERDPHEEIHRAQQEAGDQSEGSSSDRDAASGASQEPSWPDPLASDAFHGLAGEVVRLIEPHTEADPAALLLQFLTAFGNAIGRGPHKLIESDEHAPNLFVVMVGRTSKARKGTSFGRIRAVMRMVDAEWEGRRIVSGLSSGEGLIWQVRDPILARQAVKEKGRVVDYEEVEADPGVTDKRLLVVEGEYATILRRMDRQGNSLSAVCRDAWDRGDLASLTKNSPARATGALISIIGHITIDELKRYLDRTECGNGFANRFLFVCTKRSKLLPEGGGRVPWGDLPTRLATALTNARGIREVGLTDESRTVWRKVYGPLSEGKPGLLGAVIGRAEAQTMRLALMYALLDGSAFIEPEHLLAALAVWQYCEASARFVFGDMLGDPVADEILAALRRAPGGISRTEISAIFGRHVAGNQLNRALATLAAQGLAVCEHVETRGRPAELWKTTS